MVFNAQDGETEPMTLPDENRFTIFPILRPDLWAWYKKMEHLTWTAQDADLSQDRGHWKRFLNEGERVYYSYIFGMFGAADEEIIRNLGDRFTREFQWPEIQYFYRQQAQNEGVHSESYSLQIETLFEGEERDRIFNAVLNMPVVGKMMAWADKWMASKEGLSTRAVAFAMFEGIMFQGQFGSVQLLKSRNILPGVTTLNELISRDEATHTLFACYLVKHYFVHKPSESRVHEILSEVIELIDEFFAAALDDAKKAMGLSRTDPSPVRNVTLEKMSQYVRSVAGAVMADMGYRDPYRVSNPYPETEKLSLNHVAKTNFFEDIVTQYSQKVDYKFAIDAQRCSGVGIWLPEGCKNRTMLGALMTVRQFRSVS